MQYIKFHAPAVRACLRRFPAYYLLGLALGLATPVYAQSGGGNFAEKIADMRGQQQVDDRVESAIEEQFLSVGGTPLILESMFEERVEEAVEENIAETVTEEVENSVEISVEENLEQSIDQEVEDEVEAAVVAAMEDRIEGVVEESIEEDVAQNLEQDLESNLEAEVEEQVADAVEEQLESEIDEILESIESDFEIDENRINKEQWLVMAEPEVFEELAEEGYLFTTVTDLPGMGLRLAEVAAPSSFDITEIRQGVIDVVGKERAEVDLNHFYTAGTLTDTPTNEGIAPRSAMRFPADTDQLSLRIGMIDSEVDLSHPSLDTAAIEQRSFVATGARKPDFHGTAIASIIAADGETYRGLAPRAQLYAATVFELDRQRGEIASTVSLVRALDWLISSGVDVVNISLAGPPNRLLETALERAAQQDVVILAAAGNGGPVAKPMYPAAYDSVVAVTAVGPDGQVFRLANRGEYLDLAAPGVSLLHAHAGGGYSASSGTSFAVPFAATAAARLRHIQPEGNVLQTLFESAQDLGAPGRDEVYGYGLLQPEKT